MKGMSIEESLKDYPFLSGIPTRQASAALEVRLTAFDDKFLSLSLLEDESQAAGHFNVHKFLYVVRNGKLEEVSVKRITREIWPPAYLHPGSQNTDEYNNDEPGESETVAEALQHHGIAGAQYVVLYTVGSDGYNRRSNDILIAPV